MRRLLRLLGAASIPAPWDIWAALVTYGPALVAAMAVIAAYVERLPWTLVVVTGALTFGGAATGMLRFSEWRERNRVRAKLMFSNLQFLVDWVGSAAHPTVEAVQYRLVLVNVGSFPIYFRVERMKAAFSGRTSPESTPHTEGVTMPSRPSGLAGPRITLNPPIKVEPGRVEVGEFVFEIAYGRKEGNLPYRLAHRVRPQLTGINQTQVSPSWAYAEDRTVIQPRDW